MAIPSDDFYMIQAKLLGIFEMRDIMIKVRSETRLDEIEKNESLSKAISMSFELVDNYLKKLRA